MCGCLLWNVCKTLAKNNSARFSITSIADTWRRVSLLFCKPPAAMKGEVLLQDQRCIWCCTVNLNS